MNDEKFCLELSFEIQIKAKMVHMVPDFIARWKRSCKDRNSSMIGESQFGVFD